MTYQPHQSEDATLKPVALERPRCAVRGAIRPSAMCGSVIVGMEFCGFKGRCEHQRAAGVSRPDHQSPAPTHADGESK